MPCRRARAQSQFASGAGNVRSFGVQYALLAKLNRLSMTESLRALSPIDGRYAEKTAALRPFLSEWALMKYRLTVELRWLIALSEEEGVAHVRQFTAAENSWLSSLCADFDDCAARRVKAIEARTKHDVKAIEYYIRERLRDSSLRDVEASAHFACTSDDINNLAYAMMIRDAIRRIWQPAARAVLARIAVLARETAGTPMLARTHGQAATPTTLGKELAVFRQRLARQLKQIDAQEYLGKFNGATGAYNAHRVAYPDVDWRDLSRRFVGGLGLTFNPLTTQIEPHDYLAELAHALMRFNTILLDFCRDIWTYISLGVFRQGAAADDIGSSTMPHKVNPIDFENAEANLGISRSGLAHLADKLPVSRMQRDLSDSSAMRNFGVAIAHSYLALDSAQSGLDKLSVDHAALAAELDEAWEVLAEAIQTVLRKQGYADAYERLKTLTRGRQVTPDGLRGFIAGLDLPSADKARLMELTPATYLGYAEELALDALESE